MGDLALGLLIPVYLAVGVFLFVCWMIIAHKAGYSYWLGLLTLIPVVNLVFFGILAFDKWPILSARDRPVKVCLKCNKEYTAGLGSFCSVCGGELVVAQKKCPGCSYLADYTMTYCPACGTALTENPDGGYPLQTEDESSSPFDSDADLESSGKNPLNVIIIIVLAFIAISVVVIVLAM